MKFFESLRKQKLLSFSLLLFTLSIGILIGTLISSGVSAEKGQAAPDASPLVIPKPAELSSAFTELAKQLEPSVVNIKTDYAGRSASSRNRQRMRPAPGDEEDSGMDLFRRFFGEVPESLDIPRMPRQEATGSGVIVDPNGYILTNLHVVDRADRIKVRMAGDAEEYEAKLIGADRETDLAVIKIDAGRKLAPAKIGNSDAVQVGDWAVAIGSPFGLQTTVTAGIISAKGRDRSDVPGAEQFQHFLQTDAAINPGNSGGPLLNIQGEVIGINTAIATQNGGYQGVGFALPVNEAVKVYNQIIQTGRVTRGSIGVALDAAAPELLAVYGAKSGAFISQVRPGSPADKAGIREEDVIVAMNGKPIRSSDELVNSVAESPVGTDATLTVVRDGKKRDLRVTIGDRAEVWTRDARVRARPLEEPGESEVADVKFGLFVVNLTEADREELGYSGDGGVRITRIDPASFADDIGLRPNDVIVSINRQPINNVDDIRRVQNNLKRGDPVAFKLMRPGTTVFGGRGAREWTSAYRAGKLSARD